MVSEGEVSRIELESVTRPELLGECCEVVIGDLDDTLALGAHGVVVGSVVTEVVNRWAVSEVDVVNDSASFEFVQRAVDGCGVDVRIRLLNDRREFIDRDVVVGSVEGGFDDGATLRRCSQVAGSKSVEDLIDVDHLARLHRDAILSHMEE